MKLTSENYLFGRKVVDDTLSIDDDKIEFHIRNSVKSFIGDIDTSDMENRNYIFQFLQHISSLYLNYCLNGNIYFLSEDKIEKCFKSRKFIVKIHEDLRNDLKEMPNRNIDQPKWTEVTDEFLKLKPMYYGGGIKLKIGDLIMSGYTMYYSTMGTPPANYDDHNNTLVANNFVWDSKTNFIYQLYTIKEN
jgi:hypothetical protein